MIKKLSPLLLVLLLAGCPIGGKNSEENLFESSKSYYNLLMWKYYERCAAFVLPESRSEFEQFSLDFQDKLHITSHEVRLIDMSPVDEDDEEEEEKAMITVRMTYYLYPSVTERSVMIKDKWVRVGKQWLVEGPEYTEVFSPPTP